ncbi:MAG TPA: DNA internalization-related competence protein ComEC/Rec2 [Hydrogenophaga sp.]|uniref:DNA internalization-related competence protein ComEC/Rec2 n=1 Tax=Hydrogenophaga sp. TaxID=1904254 RepID=UPI002C9F68CE|nr:DNA internalization-related competence protein ComEC/Rec2 [Hydrogenophaga sp.]HSX94940.1 DNA internalization-related competence protein ComEC/Rec2 [Hydrogenophaga sp.]
MPETPRAWRGGWALAGVVLGTATQLQQSGLWAWWGYVAVALGGLWVLAWRRRLAWLFAGAALAFGGTGLRAVALADEGLAPALEGRDIAVIGRVSSLPVMGTQGERFEFLVERARLDGEPVRLPPRLLLGWYGGPQRDGDRPGGWTVAHRSPGLVAGERWAFEVRLKRAHGSLNPHGFDRERWLWERGILATGYVRAGPRDPAPERLGQSGRHPVDLARQRVAEAMAERLGDSRAAGVLAALAVGEQSAIEREDWALFRDTGVAHLMAISGLHVTLFAWLATALIAWGWRRATPRWPALALRWPRPVVAGWGGVACAAAYAMFSGWGVPSQRTVLMLAVVVGLRLSVRRWPWPAVWLLVMAAVLVLDPWAMLSAGFWLSFVAVGILFAADPARAVAAGGLASRGAEAFRRLLREQSLMTVALAPLTLLLFGQVSVVGLIANLIAIPWVTLVITPLALLGVLAPPLWTVAAWAVEALAPLLQWLAAWPGAVLQRPVPPLPLALIAVAGGVLLALRLPAVARAAGALLVLPVLLWSPPRPPEGEFEVMALDVGQGGAVLVRTARHALLYDTGPRWNPEADAGDRIVLPLLRALGERPDTVVVSHRDSDHSGGAEAVRAAFPDARWLSSYDEDPARHCQAGQRWTWDGVDFEVLHPGPREWADRGLSTNAMSCVLRIASRQGASAWLTGDIPAAQEVRLALSRPNERATLLMAPHHGSASSSSPVLLNSLRPRWVIVQSGYRNRFGHPARVVVERYEEKGIDWVASPGCGAATWRSEVPDNLWCERGGRRRYWHYGAEER